MNIKYRRRRLGTAEKLALATDFNNNISIKELVKKYAVAQSTIYKILRWAKVEVK